MNISTAVRIGDLGRVVTGRTPPSAEPAHFKGDIPFLTPSDMDGENRSVTTERAVSTEWDTQQVRISLPPKAVCVVCIGATIGKVSMTKTRSQSNQQINSIIVDEARFDPFFVYYRLRLMRDELRQKAAGAATPIINKSVFSDLKIDVPSLDVQRRIASILGAYDDLIEVNRRRIALLEEMARRLFEEWFVHFRFPGHEDVVSRCHSSAPVDWHNGTVDDGLRFIRGCSYRSVELSDSGGLPFVNLKCVKRDGGFRRDGLKRYTGSYRAEQALKQGDVVMAVTDMTQERRIVGQAALIPRLDEPLAVLSMDLVKVESKARTRLPFLYFWLRFSGFSKIAAQHANGANVLHLSPKAMVGLPMVIPPIDIQEAFCQVVEPVMAHADLLAAIEARLAASRDLLLPRLISGELSVSAAERELEVTA